MLVCVMAFGFTACGDNSGGGGDTPGGTPPAVDAEGNTIVKIMFHVDKSSTEG